MRPAAHGGDEDRTGTADRVRTLIGHTFHHAYSVSAVTRLPPRTEYSAQVPGRGRGRLPVARPLYCRPGAPARLSYRPCRHTGRSWWLWWWWHRFTRCGKAVVSESTMVPGDAVGRELLGMVPKAGRPEDEAAFLEELVAERRVVIRLRWTDCTARRSTSAGRTYRVRADHSHSLTATISTVAS
ncbi:hypothetical protein GCM10010358_68970 [Streptomyces minutiscleroticus]|uniref:Transposase n=1 Tax=Streptomyces minutiscleroticus TaxID=68238 RepID=A0A918NYT2_9ACTN|nr:hypothetical protein GCM10010358_68970 [Streptomyces minutiscleroticus]